MTLLPASVDVIFSLLPRGAATLVLCRFWLGRSQCSVSGGEFFPSSSMRSWDLFPSECGPGSGSGSSTSTRIMWSFVTPGTEFRFLPDGHSDALAHPHHRLAVRHSVKRSSPAVTAE